ncbi:MAG: hypothetical protein KR126chlam1_00380 [Chlamydiae bacterium]|nr:hypothetical protein [Chlamydiota bacterium]
MRLLASALLSLIALNVADGAEFFPKKANPTDVRIVGVKPTPEPGNVKTVIQFPKEKQVVGSSSVNVQIRLTGFPLGVPSNDFDRAKQIYNDPNGQSMLVFVDNNHPIEIYKSFIDSLDGNNLFFDLTLTTQIPYTLQEGMHVIRAFPDRSFGESLKSPGSYDASIFYVGKRENNLNVNLKAPYLTYNEPLETMTYTASKPLLLDFYLSNIQLSRDGYKVRVTIDGNIERLLTQWIPYYIYGLAAGRHTVRLQLLDEKNEVEPGLFNDVTRTISVR